MYQKRLRDVEDVYFRYAPPQAFRNQSSLDKLPNPPFPGAAAWQCSVYYYWFLFMREFQLNTTEHDWEMLEHIEDSSLNVRAAFGDVTEIGFLEWWIMRGRHVFCEPSNRGVRALELHEIEHGLEMRSGKPYRPLSDPNIYLQIPVHQDFEKSIVEVRKFLRQAKEAQHNSPRRHHDVTAFFPVFTKPVLTALEKSYRALCWRNSDPNISLAEIAVKVGLAARTDNKDTANRSANASLASKALKQAALLTEWAGRGVFPVTSNAQVPKAQDFADHISEVLSGPRRDQLQQALHRGKATENDLRDQAREHGLDLYAVR
jgi:hypothetical protein